jgi:Restriction Enzyme Adenine Methylase Associated
VKQIKLEGDLEMTEKKRTPKKIEVSLADLVEAGVVKAGRKITASYKGKEVAGTVQKDGKVKVDGEVYDSLSTAGRAVMRANGNDKPAVNGWAFFRVNVGGEWVPIATLRDSVQQ